MKCRQRSLILAFLFLGFLTAESTLAFAADLGSARLPIKGLSLLAATPKASRATTEPLEVPSGELGAVVIFMSSHCPCSNSHIQLVKDLAHDFAKFNFVVVHSNADEPLAEALDYFRKAELPMPVIQDEKAQLADEFRALKTPHAFVISKTGQILYRGGVTSSNFGPSAERAYLREALNDIALNRTVRQPEGRTLGCAISRNNSRSL